MLLLMLFIQYRVMVMKRRKAVSQDQKDRPHEQSVTRAKFMVHAAQTCTSYVLFVWGVMFTKAFQGVHCIALGDSLVLVQDLNLVCCDEYEYDERLIVFH